jgi:hypothetical protein
MQGGVFGMLLPEPGDEGMEVLRQPLLTLKKGIERRVATFIGIGPLVLKRRKLGVEALFLCA